MNHEFFRFNSGPVLVSAKVKADIDGGLLVDPLIMRHVSGDFGTVPDSVKERNERTISQNFQGLAQDIASEYATQHFGRIRIVTEEHQPLFGTTRTTFVMHPDEHPDG